MYPVLNAQDSDTLPGCLKRSRGIRLQTLHTDLLLGLRTYVQKLGQMSKDVALGEDHVEFADWQLVVSFDTATSKHMLS